MRSLTNRYAVLMMILLCCMTSGCSGLSVGPQIRTEYVVLHAGKPMQVLENTKVEGRVLDGSGDTVTQEIGGWLVMPPSHFEALKRAAEK